MKAQEWLTLQEVLERWGMKRSTFYLRLRSGQIPAAQYPLGVGKPMWELRAIESMERDSSSVVSYDKRRKIHALGSDSVDAQQQELREIADALQAGGELTAAQREFAAAALRGFAARMVKAKPGRGQPSKVHYTRIAIFMALQRHRGASLFEAREAAAHRFNIDETTAARAWEAHGEQTLAWLDAVKPRNSNPPE